MASRQKIAWKQLESCQNDLKEELWNLSAYALIESYVDRTTLPGENRQGGSSPFHGLSLIFLQYGSMSQGSFICDFPYVNTTSMPNSFTNTQNVHTAQKRQK